MHAPLYGYNQSSVVADPTIATTDSIPIRTSFVTPEGVYRQMTVNEFFRANRIQNQVAGSVCNTPVRFSFLRIPVTRLSFAEEALPSTSDVHHHELLRENYKWHSNEMNGYIDRICHNIGREIYVFDYTSLVNSSNSAKQIDKRVYKGTFPTCHDFKQTAATLNSCELLVGFSAGQIQLVDPSQKEVGLGSSSKLFNEDRLVDKTSVTCLKWVPGANQLFVASHSSGNLYFYNEELSSPQMPINYQVMKQGTDYNVYGCKAKAERNPIYRWTVGKGAINKFEFAGHDNSLLATAGQDGFLRVFNWKTMDLIGFFKSYFGGLLCLAWSPDHRYIATGGEDDLLTVYSLAENRVVCRGQAHKSWISEVAFDCYAPEFMLEQTQIFDEKRSCPPLKGEGTCSSFATNEGSAFQNGHHFPSGHEENVFSAPQFGHLPFANCDDFRTTNANSLQLLSNGKVTHRNGSSNDANDVSHCQPQLLYRVGTVGHDCQLCLWDLSEDILASPPLSQHQFDEITVSPSPSNFANVSPRNTTVIPIGFANALSTTETDVRTADKTSDANGKSSGGRFRKFHKRGFSFGSRLAGNERKQHGNSSNGANSNESTLKRGENYAQFLGTVQCPRLEDVPMIEPLMCKKIAHERLGALLFREDCIVTACQEGIICTWARPNLLARQEAGSHDQILGRDQNCDAVSRENCDGTCV
ncbi:hypothetical protein niasHT_013605 [Heterodera trifolii]|uniref:WD_REPEATS_REGION domain-containing protein n=1 Tax=Heterodera trifolii TaxID=157864 RepID=A0ABD2LE51_9BILA